MPNTNKLVEIDHVREKLIELMTDLPCNAETCLACEFLNTKECYRRQMEIMADHLIANGVTVQQWIPVTERLPKHGEVVLVYTKHKDIFIVQRDSVSGFWLGERFDVPNKIITHWMPLPSAPKGE